MRLLLLCLCISPLSWLCRAPWLIGYRRALGDWAFFYAALHLSVYLLFDAQFGWRYIVDDLMERPYITMGALAFLLLTPLAITSNRRSQRLLKHNWNRLHKLVYPAAIAACIHLIWSAKGSQVEPWVYATILAILLSVRVVGHSFRVGVGRNI